MTCIYSYRHGSDPKNFCTRKKYVKVICLSFDKGFLMVLLTSVYNDLYTVQVRRGKGDIMEFYNSFSELKRRLHGVINVS